MPFINDQLANGRRIVEMGIGKRICSFPSSSRQMYCVAKEIIADHSIQEKYEEISAKLQMDSFTAIVNKVETLLIK